MDFLTYNRKIIQTNSYLEIYEYEKSILSQGKDRLEDTEIKEKRNPKRKFDELTQEEQDERLKRISKT